jgi:hypothetical protein
MLCHFSTLNVGLAGTGNQTQATCLAGSVSRRSAIHYAFGYTPHPFTGKRATLLPLGLGSKSGWSAKNGILVANDSVLVF